MAKRNPTPAGTGASAGSNDGPSKSERRAQRAAEASAALAARRRREQIRRVGIIGAIVVALAVVFTVLVWSNVGKGGSSASGAPPAGQSSYGMTIGNPSAPHQVVIYEDFLCPYCGMFEASSHTGLAAAAAAGKVYVDYRPFHFLPEDYSAQALNAFAAVKSIAGTDAAKKFHDYLYAHQPSEQGPFPSLTDLSNSANQFVPQAKQQQVDQAIQNNSYASFVTGATNEATTKANVQGTPTILLDGNKFLEGNSWPDVAQKLIAAVGG
jgi:protein-disulfide isomerase